MLYLLDPDDSTQGFPDPANAETEPDGLLAVGGDLSPKRLLNAYRNGIFPWYSEEQPILWWSPDPRLVLVPDQVHVSRSLRKTLRRDEMSYSIDLDFGGVIRACAGPRRDAEGTWITSDMIQAYERLHELGSAHSVEVWQDGGLVGGLYGVALGGAFFGESMFTRQADTSKVAMVALCRRLEQWKFAVIDCQIHTDHLVKLGARELPRADFLETLELVCDLPSEYQWQTPRTATSGLLKTSAPESDAK